MYDPHADPTAKDIEDATARYLAHHELAPGESVSHVVTLAEVVQFYDDGRPPSYRRVRIADVRTHPAILERQLRPPPGAETRPLAAGVLGRLGPVPRGRLVPFPGFPARHRRDDRLRLRRLRVRVCGDE